MDPNNFSMLYALKRRASLGALAPASDSIHAQPGNPEERVGRIVTSILERKKAGGPSEDIDMERAAIPDELAVDEESPQAKRQALLRRVMAAIRG